MSFVALVLAMTAGAWLGKGSSVAGASPWWPPAGITFAYLAIAGVRGIFPVLVARYVAVWIVFFDWSESFLPAKTMVRSAMIVIAYALVAVPYKRHSAGPRQRKRLALFLGLGVLLGPALAGFASELVRVGFDPATAELDFETLRTFWVGDAVAIASLAPFLVVAGHWLSSGEVRWPNRDRLRGSGHPIEVGAIVLSPALVLWIGSTDQVEPRLALTVLPLLWVTLRHRPVIALAGLFMLNTTIAYVTGKNLASARDVLELQSIMLAAAVAALIMGVEGLTREIEMEQSGAREARYRRLVDGSPDLIVGFDFDGQPLRPSTTELAHEAELADQVAQIWMSLPSEQQNRNGVVEHDWVLETDAGSRWYRSRFAKELEPSPSILSITTDMTEVRTAELELAHAKTHDNLTGLPGRDELFDVLTSAQDRLQHEVGLVAVIHVGIDQFGAFNTAHGPEAGDRVLRRMAERINEQVPDGCRLARLVGDEFAIAGFLSNANAAKVLVADIIALGREPIASGEFNSVLTISGGLATTDVARTNHAELFRSAEVALNAAKEGGGDHYVECDPQLLLDAQSRAAILVGLRRAVGTNELIFHYQPEVDLVSGEIVGYEALLRWNHPARGLLLASEFIEAAEESRLIDNITFQLIDQAVAQLGEFSGVGGRDLFMGINLAPTQLEDEGLVAFVASACREHDVGPERLRIEVTENTAMRETGRAPEVLRQLRDLGASVAIDDFGTGYASIGRLHKLPVNVIKIDRQFVTNITTDETDRALVSMVVALAEGLNLSVIAEGIETPEQRNELVSLGCVRGQGYGLARPASAEQALSAYSAGGSFQLIEPLSTSSPGSSGALPNFDENGDSAYDGCNTEEHSARGAGG